MPESDALHRARELRAEADAFLAETGLPERLREHGTFHLTGSYVYDLMTRREIDVCLAVEAPRPGIVHDIIGRLLATTQVVSLRYRNELALRTEGNPRGLLLGVDVRTSGGVEWTIDLLIADADEVERVLDRGRAVEERLGPESREAILAVKSRLGSRAAGRPVVGAEAVYDAVMNHGVRTVEEWESWCKGGAASPPRRSGGGRS